MFLYLKMNFDIYCFSCVKVSKTAIVSTRFDLLYYNFPHVIPPKDLSCLTRAEEILLVVPSPSNHRTAGEGDCNGQLNAPL